MKTHMENGQGYRHILHKALCGFKACWNSGRRAYIKNNPAEVTCKKCLSILRRRDGKIKTSKNP